ncbi:hypothetical protein PR001_g12295 [Phytophthora rubi]|uniref:RxLR effector protein n=1 Tax=Phytophthora rubi TaxID=129364 RepID=A0A6A3M3F6_9STRA|nr:hypothetical protein PR002_g11476 [Phytophthora rubi]KAE9025960.1 hypothetical protein PR001_g12295 [Phytophthora rubi]
MCVSASSIRRPTALPFWFSLFPCALTENAPSINPGCIASQWPSKPRNTCTMPRGTLDQQSAENS